MRGAYKRVSKARLTATETKKSEKKRLLKRERGVLNGEPVRIWSIAEHKNI